MFDPRQIFCRSLLLRQHQNKQELVSITHSYETRNKNNLSRIPKMGKTISQRSYLFLGPKLYNIIPADFKSINSYTLFKSRINSWIKSKLRIEIHGLIDLKNVYYIE